MKELQEIQGLMRLAKSRSAGGKYMFWNAMDILAEARPLALERGCVITLTDELAEICGRPFIRATARIARSEGGASVETVGIAEIPAPRNGMDACQCAGTASSYARKYALNGLFALNDTKDSDDLAATAAEDEKRRDRCGLTQKKYNMIAEMCALGRPTKDGEDAREWFVSTYHPDERQTALFDRAVRDCRSAYGAAGSGEN